MPTSIQPSLAVLEARNRRAREGAIGRATRTQWFIEEVSDKVEMTLLQRTKLAAEFLKNKIVLNISKPVGRGVGSSGRVVVTERSKSGEFPRAETTLLMRTIFRDHSVGNGWAEGYVGTPIDYGLKLELQMNRSFFVRTLTEELGTVRRILTGPIK
jgi:hypothetical protein